MKIHAQRFEMPNGTGSESRVYRFDSADKHSEAESQGLRLLIAVKVEYRGQDLTLSREIKKIKSVGIVLTTVNFQQVRYLHNTILSKSQLLDLNLIT